MPSWLRGHGLAAYAAGWAWFAVAFATSQLFRPGGTATLAVTAALQVALPAALLGMAVVALARRFGPATGPIRTWLPVVALLVPAYPAAWMACVSGVNSVRNFVGTGTWRLFRPPEHVLHWHTLSGALIVATLVAVTWSYGRWRFAEQERRRSEARLLRAQLSPHFLANALHALFALSRHDPAGAERGLEGFVRILRHALRGDDGAGVVTLEEEWALMREFLDVQRLCHGPKLRWEAELDDDALDCAVPPLIIQPLLENAVVHGVAPSTAGATIRITAACPEDTLILRVADDGPGCSASSWQTAPGIGLRSVRARLLDLHGAAARVQVDSEVGHGFAVTLRIPQHVPG